MRGAEAVVSHSTFEGKPCLVKDRIPKSYRIKELDVSLRKRRTKREAKLLRKALEAGVPCPAVLETSEFTIKISYLEGDRPEENRKNIKNAAQLLAKLHSLDIIHGDFTFANLLLLSERRNVHNCKRSGASFPCKGKMHVIDFGLGSFSHKIEHKTIDVFTMLLSIHDKKFRKVFLDSYLVNSKDSEKIKERLEHVSKRVRYS